jgi:hypothetical protein
MDYDSSLIYLHHNFDSIFADKKKAIQPSSKNATTNLILNKKDSLISSQKVKPLLLSNYNKRNPSKIIKKYNFKLNLLKAELNIVDPIMCKAKSVRFAFRQTHKNKSHRNLSPLLNTQIKKIKLPPAKTPSEYKEQNVIKVEKIIKKLTRNPSKKVVFTKAIPETNSNKILPSAISLNEDFGNKFN